MGTNLKSSSSAKSSTSGLSVAQKLELYQIIAFAEEGNMCGVIERARRILKSPDLRLSAEQSALLQEHDVPEILAMAIGGVSPSPLTSALQLRETGYARQPVTTLPPALILDIETVRAVDPGEGKRIPGVEYVPRWPQTDDERRQMRIACVAVQRADDDEQAAVYDGYDMAMWGLLDSVCQRASLIVTFGGDGFDLPMLRAHGIHHLPPSYDLRTVLREALGLKPEDRSGFGLTDWAKANGCGEKSFDAVTAPIRWQRNGPGDRESVRQDCANDVWLIARLFRLICAQGYLLHPATGERVSVAAPVDVAQ